MKLIAIRQQTPCQWPLPIPALSGSRTPVFAMYRDVQVSRETGSRERSVHPSGSYGCIASRGGRGAPPRSGGDLTPGGAKTRGGIRSDLPPTGGRIPGYAGAPALRLERVLHSRAASGHASHGNCSLHCSRLWHPASLYRVHPWTRTSCMAQASLSTGTRSHLLPAVVRRCTGMYKCRGRQDAGSDQHGPGQPLDRYAVSPSPGSR